MNASLNGEGKNFSKFCDFKLATILIPTHVKVVILQVSGHTYLHNLHTYRIRDRRFLVGPPSPT